MFFLFWFILFISIMYTLWYSLMILKNENNKIGAFSLWLLIMIMIVGGYFMEIK